MKESRNKLGAPELTPNETNSKHIEVSITDEEITEQRDKIFLLIKNCFYSSFPNRHEAAEDLTQETLISAMAHKSQLHEKKDLNIWLNTIARNKFRDYLRKSRSSKHPDRILHGPNVTSLEKFTNENENLHPKIKTSLIGESLTSEARRGELSEDEKKLVTEFTKTLTPLHAKVFLMSCEGLGVLEISRLLHKNPNTIKVMNYRARKKFIKYIKKNKFIISIGEIKKVLKNISENRGKKISNRDETL